MNYVERMVVVDERSQFKKITSKRTETKPKPVQEKVLKVGM